MIQLYMATQSMSLQQNNFEMIYTIASPFTMGDTPPTINMSFGTRGALEVESLVNGSDDTCRVGPSFPKFRVTVKINLIRSKEVIFPSS